MRAVFFAPGGTFVDRCRLGILLCQLAFVQAPSQNRTRIEKTREAATDKRGIESERVHFAAVHGLGPAVVAPRPEDAATVAPKLLNPSSKEGWSGPGLPEQTGRLATLKTIEPAGINAVAEDEWVDIEIAVHSGATETVMSEEALTGSMTSRRVQPANVESFTKLQMAFKSRT